MPKSRRPKDVNQLAAAIVRESTSELAASIQPAKKNPAAVYLGRLGGLKGGKARAKALTPARRRQIARNAARAKWLRRKA